MDQTRREAHVGASALDFHRPLRPHTFNAWSDRMKKLTTSVFVALFALAGAATSAADNPPKAADAKASGVKASDKAASAAPAASTPAKKKEKKGGC